MLHNYRTFLVLKRVGELSKSGSAKYIVDPAIFKSSQAMDRLVPPHPTPMSSQVLNLIVLVIFPELTAKGHFFV